MAPTYHIELTVRVTYLQLGIVAHSVLVLTVEELRNLVLCVAYVCTYVPVQILCAKDVASYCSLETTVEERTYVSITRAETCCIRYWHSKNHINSLLVEELEVVCKSLEHTSRECEVEGLNLLPREL